MYKKLMNRLNQIHMIIVNHKVSPQEAIDKIFKACRGRRYQDILDNATDMAQISNADDYADTARERIVNDLRTECEPCIAFDGADLKYIDEHHPQYVNTEDACGQPLNYNDALDLIHDIKKTINEDKEAVSHD